MISLCTVAPDAAHMIEFPLEAAGVPYRIEDGVVLVPEGSLSRAARALRRYGRFRRSE